MAVEQQTLTGLFLETSRHQLADEFWPRMRGCVESLTPEQVWWRPNDASNSIGNLLLHLNGNVNQWLISSFTRSAAHRDRPAEFAARGGTPPADLVRALDDTIRRASTLLSQLTEADLLATYQVQGYTVSGLYAVYHVVEHFGMHHGQVLYITKLLRSEDLGFYRHLDKSGRVEPSQ